MTWELSAKDWFFFDCYQYGESLYIESVSVWGESTKGDTIVYAGPGKFYLSVRTIPSWKITVEDYY